FRRNKVKKSANIFLHNRHYEKFADGTVKDIEDEIPFDVPEGWAWCRLGRICDFIGGGTPDKSRNDFWNGTINWASVKDIKGDFLYSTEDKITEIGLKESSAHLASKGDVILVTRISPGKAIITQIETSINQDLKIVIPKINLNKQFLLYFFQGSESDFFENSSGTTVKGIKLEFLISKLIPLPPLEEQERIVKEIEHSFTLINSLEKDKIDLQTAIKQAKSKILDLAIHGKLVPQDANDEPASVLLEKLRVEKEEKIAKGELKRDKNDSFIYKGSDNCHYQKFVDGTEIDISDKIPFEIPDNWSWCRLSELSEFISKGTTPRGGKNAYTSSGVNFLRIENIGNNGQILLEGITHISEEEHLGFLKRSILQKNDLIISIAGTLGKTAIIQEKDLPINTNQAIAFVRLIKINSASLQYLRDVLESEIIKEDLLKQTKVTSIPNLTLEIISNCLIPLPPLAEQKRIVEKIENAFAKLDQIAEQLA
ncbi:MAG: restriction endonuclease subunit S, partial [Treponema sp.]